MKKKQGKVNERSLRKPNVFSLKQPKNSEHAQIIVRTGANSEFWGLITEALESNIQAVEQEMRDEDMKELPPDRYKLEMELLKSKAKYLSKLKELPETLMQWFEKPDNTVQNFDPFFTAEEIE